MSFSKDLLDGFDLLYKRTDGVLESCSKVGSFYHNLAKIEKEYSKSLSKFVSEKRKEMIDKASATQKEVGTTLNSWDVVFRELDKVAEHHNQFAEKLENDLVKTLSNYVREKQKQRKKLETDGQKLTKDMKASLENLQKSRQKYITLSKEAEVAESIHTKAKGDLAMKPNQLAKLDTKASQANEKVAAANLEYQSTLKQTNQKQAEFYTSLQPALLSEFQQFEEDRLKFMKEIAEKYAIYNAEKPLFYTGSCDNISNIIQSINIDSDIQSFVSENRTGVVQPPDIQYLSYDAEQTTQPKPKSSSSTIKIPKYKGPTGSNDILSAKEWGLTPADQNLTPEEQQNKLKAQLEELDKAILLENKFKGGLETLVRNYSNDPVAQKKTEGELQELEQKLQRLTETKTYVQSQMNEIGGSYSQPYDQQSNDNLPKARCLYSYVATNDTELSFEVGEILTISQKDDSGWWYASVGNRFGYVPQNYLEML